jgi:hypothetical protein
MNEKVPVRQSIMDKVIDHYRPIQTLKHDRNKSTGVVINGEAAGGPAPAELPAADGRK